MSGMKVRTAEGKWTREVSGKEGRRQGSLTYEKLKLRKTAFDLIKTKRILR
jgi:hypothetical protein